LNLVPGITSLGAGASAGGGGDTETGGFQFCPINGGYISSSRISLHDQRTFAFPSRYNSSSFSSNVPFSSNSWYALYNLRAERASSIESCVSVWIFSPSTNHVKNLRDSLRCRALMKYRSTVSMTCSGGTKMSVYPSDSSTVQKPVRHSLMMRKSFDSPCPMNTQPRSTRARSFLYTIFRGVSVCGDNCGSRSPSKRN